MAHASERTQRWQEVLDEHRELQRHMALLSELAAADPSRVNDWGGELARRASTLVKDFEVHFAGEAEESLFRDMELRTPHLVGKLASLRKEHGTILTELRGIAKGGPGARGPTAERLAAQVRAVVALINRHEAEETELVFRSIYEDMGVGD